MASGAPPPGGLHSVKPGGLRSPAPGGLNLSNDLVSRRLRSTPSLNLSRFDASGARVIQSVTAIPGLGRASSVTYAWTLPTKPGGSILTVPTTPTAATAGITPDAAGVYVMRVVATFNDSPATVVTKDWQYTSA